eukprot:TRINITY_DN2745_c0_g1_i2.p1 TRINITY_DN2745_c0_g1~~TRINITY_DN2745_c0_g1_i2.p1  ORF type:complete len:389 (+),score=71.79 TRINITY_DN2745_c0_g1_i2:206-1372(+)
MGLLSQTEQDLSFSHSSHASSTAFCVRQKRPHQFHHSPAVKLRDNDGPGGACNQELNAREPESGMCMAVEVGVVDMVSSSSPFIWGGNAYEAYSKRKVGPAIEDTLVICRFGDQMRCVRAMGSSATGGSPLNQTWCFPIGTEVPSLEIFVYGRKERRAKERLFSVALISLRQALTVGIHEVCVPIITARNTKPVAYLRAAVCTRIVQIDAVAKKAAAPAQGCKASCDLPAASAPPLPSIEESDEEDIAAEKERAMAAFRSSWTPDSGSASNESDAYTSLPSDIPLDSSSDSSHSASDSSEYVSAYSKHSGEGVYTYQNQPPASSSSPSAPPLELLLTHGDKDMGNPAPELRGVMRIAIAMPVRTSHTAGGRLEGLQIKRGPLGQSILI